MSTQMLFRILSFYLDRFSSNMAWSTLGFQNQPNKTGRGKSFEQKTFYLCLDPWKLGMALHETFTFQPGFSPWPHNSFCLLGCGSYDLCVPRSRHEPASCTYYNEPPTGGQYIITAFFQSHILYIHTNSHDFFSPTSTRLVLFIDLEDRNPSIGEFNSETLIRQFRGS